MEAINFGAVATFVIVSTYTPGPNNITSSSMGVAFGYRKTLPYLFGIVCGFFGIMLLCGFISATLYSVFPSLEGTMRLIGAAYILWLAYKTLRSSYPSSDDEAPVLGFADGFLLQLVNPKLWIFALTLYTTFLATITDQWELLLISAILLTGVAFSATSTWAISGAIIKRFLHIPWLKHGINIALALLLAYTAVDLSGLL